MLRDDGEEGGWGNCVNARGFPSEDGEGWGRFAFNCNHPNSTDRSGALLQLLPGDRLETGLLAKYASSLTCTKAAVLSVYEL